MVCHASSARSFSSHFLSMPCPGEVLGENPAVSLSDGTTKQSLLSCCGAQHSLWAMLQPTLWASGVSSGAVKIDAVSPLLSLGGAALSTAARPKRSSHNWVVKAALLVRWQRRQVLHCGRGAFSLAWGLILGGRFTAGCEIVPQATLCEHFSTVQCCGKAQRPLESVALQFKQG